MRTSLPAVFRDAPCAAVMHLPTAPDLLQHQAALDHLWQHLALSPGGLCLPGGLTLTASGALALWQMPGLLASRLACKGLHLLRLTAAPCCCFTAVGLVRCYVSMRRLQLNAFAPLNSFCFPIVS